MRCRNQTVKYFRSYRTLQIIQARTLWIIPPPTLQIISAPLLQIIPACLENLFWVRSCTFIDAYSTGSYLANYSGSYLTNYSGSTLANYSGMSWKIIPGSILYIYIEAYRTVMHTTWFFYKVIGWYHFRPGIIYNYLSGYDLAIIPDSHWISPCKIFASDLANYSGPGPKKYSAARTGLLLFWEKTNYSCFYVSLYFEVTFYMIFVLLW